MNCEAPSILAPVEVLRWQGRFSADSIYERSGVDTDMFKNCYKWVWNVAADPNGEITEFRFWTREILTPEATRGLSLDQVIHSILPMNRTQYHSGEVANAILCVSRDLLASLREELNGKLGANSSFFPRDGLERFLRNRWLWNTKPTEAAK